MSEVTIRAALREAESSLRQAREDMWRAFDTLVGSDPQAAVDRLLADIDQRIDPLVDAVMRLSGDPRHC
jgi:hypothetical protein